MNLKKIFPFLTSKAPSLPKSPFAVEFAFECGGKDYFEFIDKSNIPAMRGLNSLTFYDEMRNTITNDYLHAYIKKGDEIFSNPKQINISEVVLHHNRLKERLNFIISKDIIYKIASVAFIDKDEDPSTYDFEYNKRKIENWKKNGADAFFLQKPLRNLIPFLKQQGDFSPTYLRVVENLESLQLNIHSLQMFARELEAENSSKK